MRQYRNAYVLRVYASGRRTENCSLKTAVEIHSTLSEVGCELMSKELTQCENICVYPTSTLAGL